MFLRKIPGFRSGKNRNKCIASIGYLFFFFLLIGEIGGAPTAWDVFVNLLLEWAVVLFAVLIPAANLFQVRTRFFLLAGGTLTSIESDAQKSV